MASTILSIEAALSMARTEGRACWAVAAAGAASEHTHNRNAARRAGLLTNATSHQLAAEEFLESRLRGFGRRGQSRQQRGDRDFVELYAHQTVQFGEFGLKALDNGIIICLCVK